MARKKIGDVLLEMGIIDAHQLQSALAHQRQWGGKLGKIVVELRFATEKAIVDALAEQLGTQVIGLRALPADERAMKLVPVELARKHNLFPYKYQLDKPVDKLLVAMSDPTDLAAIDEVSFRTGKKVLPSLASDTDIEHAIRRHYLKEDVPDGEDVAPLPPPEDVPFGGRDLGEEDMEEEVVLEGTPEPTGAFRAKRPVIAAVPAKPGLAGLFDDMPQAEPEPLETLWEETPAEPEPPAEAAPGMSMDGPLGPVDPLAGELPEVAHTNPLPVEPVQSLDAPPATDWAEPEAAPAEEETAAEFMPSEGVEPVAAAEEAVAVAEEEAPPPEEPAQVQEEQAAYAGEGYPAESYQQPAEAPAWSEEQPAEYPPAEGYAEAPAQYAEEPVPSEGEQAAEYAEYPAEQPASSEAEGAAEYPPAEPAYVEGEQPYAEQPAEYASETPAEYPAEYAAESTEAPAEYPSESTEAPAEYPSEAPAEYSAEGAEQPYAEQPYAEQQPYAETGYADEQAYAAEEPVPVPEEPVEAAEEPMQMADEEPAQVADEEPAQVAEEEPPLDDEEPVRMADEPASDEGASGAEAVGPQIPAGEAVGSEFLTTAQIAEGYAEAIAAASDEPVSEEPVPSSEAEVTQEADYAQMVAASLAAGTIPEGTDANELLSILFRALIQKGLITEDELRAELAQRHG